MMGRHCMSILTVMTAGVNVDEGVIEALDLVEERMPHLLADSMAIGNGHVAVDGHVQRRVQAMTDPTQAHTADRLDP